MNNEMAYLLGMITGNGEVQRGATETTIVVEIPHLVEMHSCLLQQLDYTNEI